ncbi:hypothetical protein [Undibacterium sp. RuTC16W]|uniref:hypothetical protein n=1 Tax=Undibacterium sp. RuTC16W TaxID=3413048 RepID=UPI003BF1AFAE
MLFFVVNGVLFSTMSEMNLSKRIRNFSLGILSFMLASLAYGIEIDKTEVGAIVKDGIVQIGSHQYPLPPGEWVLIGKNKSRVTFAYSSQQGADILTAYLINVKDKQFRASVKIEATTSSTATHRWMPEPCKRDDVVFKDTMKSNYDYPECLLINHNTNAFASSNTWLNAVPLWLENNQIKVPVTTLLAQYDKYQTGDFVKVRFWINPELAGQTPSKNASWIKSDWHKDRLEKDTDKQIYMDKFIAWTKQLPSIYKKSLTSDDRPLAVPDFPDLAQ